MYHTDIYSVYCKSAPKLSSLHHAGEDTKTTISNKVINEIGCAHLESWWPHIELNK